MCVRWISVRRRNCWPVFRLIVTALSPSLFYSGLDFNSSGTIWSQRSMNRKNVGCCNKVWMWREKNFQGIKTVNLIQKHSLESRTFWLKRKKCDGCSFNSQAEYETIKRNESSVSKGLGSCVSLVKCGVDRWWRWEIKGLHLHWTGVFMWSSSALPAVTSTCTDDELIITGEANVCHVSRVAEVTLVFCL